MKEKFIRFMQGRYGVDQFSKFLSIAGFIVLLLSPFVGGALFYSLGIVILFYCYFRIFSKNRSKRIAENQKYLQSTEKIRSFIVKQKSLMKQRKTHHIYSCPSCKQKIRVPKGRGKIEIRCPKCNTKFIKNS